MRLSSPVKVAFPFADRMNIRRAVPIGVCHVKCRPCLMLRYRASGFDVEA